MFYSFHGITGLQHLELIERIREKRTHNTRVKVRNDVKKQGYHQDYSISRQISKAALIGSDKPDTR